MGSEEEQLQLDARCYIWCHCVKNVKRMFAVSRCALFQAPAYVPLVWCESERVVDHLVRDGQGLAGVGGVLPLAMHQHLTLCLAPAILFLLLHRHIPAGMMEGRGREGRRYIKGVSCH